MSPSVVVNDVWPPALELERVVLAYVWTGVTNRVNLVKSPQSLEPPPGTAQSERCGRIIPWRRR